MKHIWYVAVFVMVAMFALATSSGPAATAGTLDPNGQPAGASCLDECRAQLNSCIGGCNPDSSDYGACRRGCVRLGAICRAACQ